MQKQSFTGKNLDEALDEAARALGVPRSQISYNTVDTGGGLLSKLFARPNVKIEAWVEAKADFKTAAREMVRQAIERDKGTSKPQRERGSDTPRPEKKEMRAASPQQSNNKRKPREPRKERPASAARPPREQRNTEDGMQNTRPSESFANPKVRELFNDYVDAFIKSFDVSSDNCTVNYEEEGRALVSVNDTHLEESLARTDRVSSAFEHIFKRIVQKKLGDVADRIVLEAGNSVELREDKLKEMALSMAEKVKSTGRAIKLTAKSSQERRTIHMTLDGFEGVATKSVGSGEQRKLIIYSTNPEHRRPPREHPQGERRAAGAEATGMQDDGQPQQRRRRRRRRGGRNRGGPQQQMQSQQDSSSPVEHAAESHE